MKRITDQILHLFFKDNASSNTSILVHKSLKVLLLQVVAVVLVFAGNVMIARWFGDEIYGLYSHLFNWFSVLTVIAMTGMDDYHVAVLPALKEKHSDIAIRKEFGWSLKVTGSAAILISAVFLCFVVFTNISGLKEFSGVFTYGIYLVLLLTVMNNLIAWLRGMDHVIYGQVGDKLIRPAFFLIAVLFAGLTGYFEKNISLLIWFSGLSLLIVIIYLAIMVYRILPVHIPGAGNKDKPDTSFRKNLYFLSMSLLYLLTTRLDILSIGSLSGMKEVGYYNVASKLADFVLYPVVIVNLLLPPMLSRYHYLNDKNEILRLIRNGSRVMFGGCLLLISGIVIAGQWLLGLYGDSFQQGFLPLLILSGAHLITSMTGPVSAWFLVSGKEKAATFSMLANVLVTAVLCYFLIPAYGITGAAFSSFAGMLVFNSLIILLFYRKEKVIITPFRIFRFD